MNKEWSELNKTMQTELNLDELYHYIGEVKDSMREKNDWLKPNGSGQSNFFTLTG